MALSRSTFVVLASVTVLSTADAQQMERLQRPIDTFPEPFSGITGIRELSDGRVLVADRLERAVRLLDFAAGTMQELGRSGSGPGEYQMPSGLLALPADATLLVDLGNMRLSVITPDGRFTESRNMFIGERLLLPTGSDRSGHLYFNQGGVRFENGQVQRDPSVPVVRFDLTSEAMDTVAHVPVAQGRAQAISMSSGSGSITIQGGLAPYPMSASWAVSPDGRVAVVHADPYRVDWVSPDGTTVSGPVVAYDPVRVTHADKAAWADRRGGGGGVMMMIGGSRGGGGRALRMPRPDPDDQDWPEFKPPFPRGAVSATPEGTIWVQRHVPFGEQPAYDVFDEHGVRVRQVILPAGRRLVGFGPGKVYLINVDEDDLQWLEAYQR